MLHFFAIYFGNNLVCIQMLLDKRLIGYSFILHQIVFVSVLVAIVNKVSNFIYIVVNIHFQRLHNFLYQGYLSSSNHI